MHVRELRKGGAISDFPNISLSRKSLKPAAGDSPSPEKTADGYELRSQGPATLGADALDNLVSRSRSSSSRSADPPTAAPALAAAPAPSAPATPPPVAAPTSSLAATPPTLMAEPSNADLAKLIAGHSSTITSLQADVATLKKDKEKSSSSSGPGPGGDGQHHNDRPLRFQKLDFPRYDGKTDPLIFINRCESYFHQQRIMEEEKVWMASYNLEDVAQLWYIQVQADRALPGGAASRTSSTCVLGRPCAQRRCSSSLSAGARAPLKSTRIASRPFFHTPIH